MKKIFIGALILMSLLIPTIAVSAADLSDSIESNTASDNACVHDWDDWTTITAATIHKTGTQSRECYNCGEIQTRTTNTLKPYVKFKKKTVSMKESTSYKLKLKYAKGDSVKKYKSSNKRIATVAKSGKVKAQKAGTAKITVTMKSGKKATCKVKVKAVKKSSSSSGSSSSGSAASGSSSSGSGSGIVYWTPGGSVYHSTSECPTLSRSRSILSGPVSSCPKSRPCKVCS